jgi:hypothetical protein
VFYAAAEKAGVKATYANFEGVTHEFFGMGAVVDAGSRQGHRGTEERFPEIMAAEINPDGTRPRNVCGLGSSSVSSFPVISKGSEHAA